MNDGFEQALQEAADYLKRTDPILAPIIRKHGLATIQPHQNYYEALVGEIIAQQLSVKAAASIHHRFLDLFGGAFPTPALILKKNVETLRTAGLSRAKATYIRDLAEQMIVGNIPFEKFDSLSNSDIITTLISVKGVGEWTAHMFLMFCMGRLDVLAYGDLGIRAGIRDLYSLELLPTPDQVSKIALQNHWHPYETIACWYIWASKDNKPVL